MSKYILAAVKAQCHRQIRQTRKTIVDIDVNADPNRTRQLIAKLRQRVVSA